MKEARIRSSLSRFQPLSPMDMAELASMRKRALTEQRICVIYIDKITDDHDRKTVERITKEQLYGERK